MLIFFERKNLQATVFYYSFNPVDILLHVLVFHVEICDIDVDLHVFISSSSFYLKRENVSSVRTGDCNHL
jgi:hypothetical protein